MALLSFATRNSRMETCDCIDAMRANRKTELSCQLNMIVLAGDSFRELKTRDQSIGEYIEQRHGCLHPQVLKPLYLLLSHLASQSPMFFICNTYSIVEIA